MCLFTAATNCLGSVLITVLSITLVEAVEPDRASHEWLRVSTDWEPDAALASAASEAKLRVALTQWLAATRPSCAQAATTENLTRLLNFPEVRRTETAEQKDRPYGTVVRAHVAIHIPPATLDAWQVALQTETRERQFTVSVKCCLSLCGLVSALAATRGLDVRTRGYRRRSLDVFLIVLVAVLLAAIWG